MGGPPHAGRRTGGRAPRPRPEHHSAIDGRRRLGTEDPRLLRPDLLRPAVGTACETASIERTDHAALSQTTTAATSSRVSRRTGRSLTMPSSGTNTPSEIHVVQETALASSIVMPNDGID